MRIIKQVQNKLFKQSFVKYLTEYPSQVIEDIRCWSYVRNAYKETLVQNHLNTFDFELRQDKIGRLYTVINVPDEFFDHPDAVQVYIIDKLRQLDEILIKCRLNDLVYPTINQIENTTSYLLVLTPSTESLDIWKFLIWLMNVGLTILGIVIINKIFVAIFGQSIVQFIHSVLF